MPSTSSLSASMRSMRSSRSAASSGRHGTRTTPAAAFVPSSRCARVPPRSRRSSSMASSPGSSESASCRGLTGRPGLAATLKASRAKLPGSGSNATMRARPLVSAATNSENSPTLPPTSTNTNGPPGGLRAISRASSARSSGSNICGVNSRPFSQPLSSGWSRSRSPQRSTSSAPAGSRMVTSRRSRMASRSPSQLAGSRLVSAITARSSRPGASAPYGCCSVVSTATTSIPQGFSIRRPL